MLLEVENLQVSYGNIRALHGIDFHLDAGEIVTIIGANGAGKSSTLRAVSRMIPAGPETRMSFDGEDLLKFPPEKVVSRLGISHVPEGRRLFGNLTVLENLQLATFSRKDRDGVRRDIRRVFAIFTRLEERKSQKAGTMSGGEQQMLAVGRAFMSGRRLMLLDEPSMGLVAASDETGVPLPERNQSNRGDGHTSGGTERSPGPEIRRPGLCARNRKHGTQGNVGRTAPQRRGEKSLFRGLNRLRAYVCG